jgi:hypothetical protein
MPDDESNATLPPATAPNPVSSDALPLVDQSVKALNNLLPALHQANLAYHQAIEPVARLSEMDGEERRQLMQQVRAANEQWNQITRKIEEALDLCEPTKGS